MNEHNDKELQRRRDEARYALGLPLAVTVFRDLAACLVKVAVAIRSTEYKAMPAERARELLSRLKTLRAAAGEHYTTDLHTRLLCRAGAKPERFLGPYAATMHAALLITADGIIAASDADRGALVMPRGAVVNIAQGPPDLDWAVAVLEIEDAALADSDGRAEPALTAV